MTPTGQIKGLPEGVELIDFMPAGEDDYELIVDVGGSHIYKGVRPGAGVGARVKPAEGYAFVPTGGFAAFNIRDLTQGRPEFVATKVVPTHTVTITAKFNISTELDQQNLEAALADVPKMPGYVSHAVE